MRLSNLFHDTMNIRINWSISELNPQVNPATCLGDTGCWIQQITAPNLVVTRWIHQCTCVFHSSWTRGAKPSPVQEEGKMDVGCWIQQVTTRIGAVICWIQQPVKLKYVVGFSNTFILRLTN